MESIESMDILGENKGIVVLQLLIVGLAIGIIIMLFMEKTNMGNLGQKMDAFKCPDPPACPKCPKCPECNLTDKGCPDCNCPKNEKCPKCPDVKTSCPKCKTITPDDIADAIFPGRNKGITSHGQYFPLDGLGKGNIEPAWSPVTNLMPNYVGGDGIPAAISFADQKLLSDKSSIALAVKKQPAIATTQGVFTKGSDKPITDTIQSDKKKPSKVAKTGGTPKTPKESKKSKKVTGATKPTGAPIKASSDKGFMAGIESKLSGLL